MCCYEFMQLCGGTVLPLSSKSVNDSARISIRAAIHELLGADTAVRSVVSSITRTFAEIINTYF